MKKVGLFIGVVLLVSFVMGAHHETEKAGEHQPDHVLLLPTDLIWKEGPASLPKGVQFAVLEGDPTKPGPFTMRLKIPANYQIPPHWHPAVEHVTVLSGSLYMGLGETLDESKAAELPVGGFAMMAIETRHFAFTKGAATIQLHGIGPWGINYVNPADDPRNKPE